MRATLAGRALLGLGVTVGVAATIAWVVGFDPAALPPALLKIAAYKLTGLAAFGLMAAGAVLMRFSRNSERNAPRHVSNNTFAELNAGDATSTTARGAEKRDAEFISEQRK